VIAMVRDNARRAAFDVISSAVYSRAVEWVTELVILHGVAASGPGLSAGSSVQRAASSVWAILREVSWHS